MMNRTWLSHLVGAGRGSGGFAVMKWSVAVFLFVVFGLSSTSGQAIAPVPVLSSNSLDFGPQKVGTTSVVQTVTVTNPGSGTLAIRDITLEGANDFTQGNNCGASLAGGASCTITVTFSPRASEPNLALAAIRTSAGTQSIALTGVGVP